MHDFVEAFKFIGRNGAVAGAAAAAEPRPPHARDAEGRRRSAWRSRWRSRSPSASGSATSIAARSWRSTSATSGARCRASSCSRSATRSSGSGLTVVELALVVLAVPPIITNAYVGVDGVDRDLVDAARGHGHERLGDPARVELPLAIPLLFAGHPHGRPVRHQHDHDRLAGRLQRQPRRHHRQRDELPPLRACSAPRSASRRWRSPSRAPWRCCSGPLTPRGLTRHASSSADALRNPGRHRRSGVAMELERTSQLAGGGG